MVALTVEGDVIEMGGDFAKQVALYKYSSIMTSYRARVRLCASSKRAHLQWDTHLSIAASQTLATLHSGGMLVACYFTYESGPHLGATCRCVCERSRQDVTRHLSTAPTSVLLLRAAPFTESLYHHRDVRNAECGVIEITLSRSSFHASQVVRCDQRFASVVSGACHCADRDQQQCGAEN